ncbi:hypothetical protein LWI29_030589 [Acer saccharum]|uniref:Uncharacterized protein n=1 Tax=Acer saccharum TaxID=4024 RepID=A0AA39SH85_ACESA|nr:hypothetical protein LWI29_030589 [Acer saccharum]
MENLSSVPVIQRLMKYFALPILGAQPSAILLSDLQRSYELKSSHFNTLPIFRVQCFYDGLTGLTQATVDNACGGAMREKTANEVFAVYEMLGENSQQRRGRDDSREERTNVDLGLQLANMSREMENLKANFGQQPIMEEVQVVNPYQASNYQGWQDHQWGSQDNPSFTEQPISGLEESMDHTTVPVGKLHEEALTDLQSGDVNSLEVEEPEFVFRSSEGIYDRVDESMRILERVFEEEYGQYDKKVVEVAQESKELISQDVSLEKKINSLEKERDSFLRVIEELKDELAQKDEALDLMKTRELDHLAKLAKAKQELKAKGKEVMPFPKDELDLGQGTSSAMVTKPSLNKSKKKATTKKSKQVPPLPPQNLKDKQPIPEVLKRPTPRLAPRQDKIKQASKQTATNKRGTISHFSPICYKCHIRGHIGSQCANMK